MCGRDHELALVRDAIAEGSNVAGVVIAGPAGVGKTRLAQEAVAGLGRRVFSVVGTPAAQPIPLAPLLDLLPAVGVPAEQGIQAARARLAGRRPRLVLLVDDAHWLDTATQTLLHLLVRARKVRVVVTVRDDAEIPPTIRDLWKEGHLRHLRLGPLGPVDSAVLLERLAGAPVEASVAAAFHHRSQGLPLALRELMCEALAEGALAVRDGLARAVAPLPSSRQLLDVIAGNQTRLGRRQRDVLDLVAVAEPVPLRVLRRLVDLDVLRDCERDGLVRLAGADQPVVMLGHPLYGEAVLAGLGSLERQLLLERLIDAAQEITGSDEALALRVACWCIEAGRPAPLDDLLVAVRLTQRALDPDRAAQAAQGLWRQRPAAETGLLYAATLSRLLRFATAYEVLTKVAGFDLTEAQRVARAAMVNETLVRLGRHDEAIAELAAAEATVSGRVARAHLRAKRAFTASVAGRTRDGLAVMMPLVDSAEPAEVAEAAAAAPCMLALDGRPVDGLALVERVERMDEAAFEAAGGYLRLPREALAIQYGLCTMYAGDLVVATQLADDGVSAAVAHGSAYLLAGWLNLLGRVQLDQGRAAMAVHTLGRVIAEAPQASGGAQRALAYNALVEAYALLGRPHEARQALGDLMQSSGNVLWYPAGLAEFACGHLAFSEGNRAAALEHFRESYRCAASQSATIALAAAHAVGRFGRPREGLELARQLPPVQGTLAPLRMAHLAALADRDAGALLEVAARLRHPGAYLFAAEAAAAATRLAAGRGGDARLATAARRLGQQVYRQLPGTLTPELTTLSTMPAVVALTSREREIATLAAQGMPSRAIATTLTVSVRTVDNHLQRVYLKLGIGGRHDLARALVPAP
jgi:pentatricopeptide repeat protein